MTCDEARKSIGKVVTLRGEGAEWFLLEVAYAPFGTRGKHWSRKRTKCKLGARGEVRWTSPAQLKLRRLSHGNA